MKKKFFAILLTLSMILALAACSGSETPVAQSTEAEEEPEEIEVAEEPEEAEAEEEETAVPLTEEDLCGILTGVEDRYVLQDAAEVDYLYGVQYGETVEMPKEEAGETGETTPDEAETVETRIIYSVQADASLVDVSTPGTYPITYTAAVNRKAYDFYMEQQAEMTQEEASDQTSDGEAEGAGAEDAAGAENAGEEDEVADENLEEVVIEKTVTIVEEEEAERLVAEGGTVWTDESQDYVVQPEDDIQVAETEISDAADANTSAAAANSKTANSSSGNKSSTSGSGSSSSSGSGSSSSGSANSSSSESASSASSGSGSSSFFGSGNSNSGYFVSSSSSHTHNFSGTVIQAATCGSTGLKKYTCSCGSWYTETIPATGNHKWVEQYTTQEVFVEDSPAYFVYQCVCGYQTSGADNESELNAHLKSSGHGTYKSVRIPATGHYESETVVSGYKCSVCGQTK